MSPSPSTPNPAEALRAAKDALRRATRAKRAEQAERMADASLAQALAERAARETHRLVGGARGELALLYASLPGEAPTALLDANLRLNGWRIAYPRIVARRPAILEAREAPALANLRPGSYGILEPPPDDARFPVAPPESIDLVIVPGLAFDRAGGRLGQGAGFYDAFLRRCANARKLGLAFDWQIVDSVPMDAGRDERLDGLIVVPSF